MCDHQKPFRPKALKEGEEYSAASASTKTYPTQSCASTSTTTVSENRDRACPPSGSNSFGTSNHTHVFNTSGTSVLPSFASPHGFEPILQPIPLVRTKLDSSESPTNDSLGRLTNQACGIPHACACPSASAENGGEWSGKYCQYAGCIKFARGGTPHCIAHGGGRRCQQEGCMQSAQGITVLENCSKSAATGGGPLCTCHGGITGFQLPPPTSLVAENTGVPLRRPVVSPRPIWASTEHHSLILPRSPLGAPPGAQSAQEGRPAALASTKPVASNYYPSGRLRKTKKSRA
mmetsp:Transcript_5655/g.9779  ORF Transcript_5655/g.9779 Transcript_5655/m.9779 type:complete len:290 (+) Transcript_5655:514-1383(+)